MDKKKKRKEKKKQRKKNNLFKNKNYIEITINSWKNFDYEKINKKKS